MGRIPAIKSKLKLAKVFLEKYEKQTANEYLIKCSDGQFHIDGDCLKFSDFLSGQIQGCSINFSIKTSCITLNTAIKALPCSSYFNSTILFNDYKAREKFEGKENDVFDLTAFRLRTIRKIFDLMHGLDIQHLSFAEAAEALIYCNYVTVSIYLKVFYHQ